MKKRVRKEGVCCSRGAATPFVIILQELNNVAYEIY